MFKVKDKVISKEFGKGKVVHIENDPTNKYWYHVMVAFENHDDLEIFTREGNYFKNEMEDPRDIKLLEGINENN